MSYSPFVVPRRSAIVEKDGRTSSNWLDHWHAVATKAGRSMTWRAAYSARTPLYSVYDVVSHDGALWIAHQPNPVLGTAVAPGSDDTVWKLVIDGGDADVEVQVDGALVGIAGILNFIAGIGITITGLDDTANGRVNITINAPGGAAVSGPAGATVWSSTSTVTGAAVTW